MPPKQETAKSELDLLPLPVSQEAVDMVLHYETGGRAYYDKFLAIPSVPAWETTKSGVTVAAGSDVGHMTPAEIQNAFEGVLPQKQIDLLKSVSGLKGEKAYYHGLPKVKHLIHISYSDAEKIFKKYTLPKFCQRTKAAFELSADRLHPHSNGALVSLVFNRGPSMANTDSRKEMREIKAAIKSGNDSKVPQLFLDMRRLWDKFKLKGLWLRRESESTLFARGNKVKK